MGRITHCPSRAVAVDPRRPIPSWCVAFPPLRTMHTGAAMPCMSCRTPLPLPVSKLEAAESWAWTRAETAWDGASRLLSPAIPRLWFFCSRRMTGTGPMRTNAGFPDCRWWKRNACVPWSRALRRPGLLSCSCVHSDTVQSHTELRNARMRYESDCAFASRDKGETRPAMRAGEMIRTRTLYALRTHADPFDEGYSTTESVGIDSTASSCFKMSQSEGADPGSWACALFEGHPRARSKEGPASQAAHR